MAKHEGAGKAQTRTGETLDEALRKAKRQPRLGPGQLERAPLAAGEDDTPDVERLNKALARAGVASRRAVDELIRAGKVSVNGQVVTQLGQKVDVRLDRVLVDGKRVALISEEAQVKVYFLLNKPPKVLTTAKDDRGRSTVMDYVAGAAEGRIYPVGRLDYDAEGALLLTNDGELAAKLMHPRTHVAKVYQVKVKGEPEERQLDLLRRGIRLEDGPTRACKIDVVKKARVNTWVEVTLTEGKNRQLKRMFWRIRHPVLKILRVKYGPVDLGDLGTGEFRELKRAEVEALRKAVDVAGTARPHA